MKISTEIVDHIAHLARLEFEGEAKESIRKDMETIISFMDKLSEVDTENVEPLIFMNESYNTLREDNSIVSISQQEALKNAPEKASDYFRIPKVLDKLSFLDMNTVSHDPFAALRLKEFRFYLTNRFFITMGIQMQSVIVG